MATTSWAVEAHQLVKDFGDNRAVNHVDLFVPAGSVYGVLGPNGAGKTTTIRILATLLRPDGGQASVFGHDVVREAHIVRQLIGVTGQYASVDETLSANENLYLFARLNGLTHSAARAKSAQLLETFDLMEAAKQPLKNFSGGMRRRLDLAVSLISQPPLLFLDEPTTGLDPRNRAQTWDIIRHLVATGSTVLLTTQYLDEADQLADRIAVIDHGTVVAEGTSDELKATTGISSLQLVLADPASLERARAVIREVLHVDVVFSPETQRINAPMAAPDAITDLLVRLRSEHIAISELSVQKPTLDEVFLTLTGRPPTLDAQQAELEASAV